MSDPSSPSLTELTTLWSVVLGARAEDTSRRAEARRQLLRRYEPAVLRFLRKAVRDEDTARELVQEFAVRLLSGGLDGADPGRGRFRDFVKGVLRHLVVDAYRKGNRLKQHASDAPEVADSADDLAALDRQYVESWREELLARTWLALAEEDRRTGKVLHTVLRFRADHPELRSAALAEGLTTRLGRAVTDVWVRQMIHRARERFGDLLLEEIAQSLAAAQPDAVEEELVELELLQYCVAALERYRAAWLAAR